MAVQNKHTILLATLTCAVVFMAFSMGSKDAAAPQKEEHSVTSITPSISYIAGEEIIFTLKESLSKLESETLKLYLSSSFGSTVVSVEQLNNKQVLKVPKAISKKTGKILWQLIDTDKGQQDTGIFEILPNPQMTSNVESYLGPETIVAGGLDYSMIVITPTDIYDNLMPNETEVTLNTFFSTSEKSYNKKTDNRITWERIYSPKKAGRMLISGSSNLVSTREKTLNINPNNATNFSITKKLVHPYADGNQIAKFKTSQIKDTFENTISDGTLVRFTVTNTSGEKMQMNAATINGIATGQFLHPSNPTLWKVEAFVLGIANSQVLDVSFNSVITELPVSFSSNNRIVSVGPITSYMGQLIPDGAEVRLTLQKCNKTFLLTSKNGMAIFEISPDICPNDLASMRIETMGIYKTFDKTIR